MAEKTERYRKACLELAETAVGDLIRKTEPDRKTKAKRMIRKYLLRQPQPPIDAFSWPKGLLAEGLWEAWLCLDEAFCLEAVQKYVDLWIAEGQKIYYVDNAINGDVLYKLHRQVPSERYEQAMEKLADWLTETCPKEEDGSLTYRAHNPGLVFADTLGMVCPFLISYGRQKNRKQWIRLGEKQLEAFLAGGMDAATGLPYHGYDRKCRRAGGNKLGIVGWGRAVGWMMMGMADSLAGEKPEEKAAESPKEKAAENPTEKAAKKPDLELAWERLAEKVVSCQRADGYFGWQLSALEGPADTSATAMIACALEQGIQCGKLPQRYETQVEKAAGALLRSVRDGRVYDCSGECLGFAQYPQVYGAYPWALGPALRLFAMLGKQRKE